MSEKTNEIMEQNATEPVSFEVVQMPDGKFKKVQNYRKYWSMVPTTEEESMTLFKVFNSKASDGLVTGFKNAIGKTFGIKEIFMNPYESFDEETGSTTKGVTTTILTTNGEFLSTSSKTSYYTLFNIFETFGYPGTESYKPIEVKIVSYKSTKGNDQIDVELIGYEK